MNAFKRMREANNLTQEQLANKLHISQQAVTKWENGYSLPRGATLIKLSKIFGCTLDELVNDK